MVEQKGSDINFKKWITKVVSLTIILLLLTFAIQYNFQIEIVFDILITLLLVLLIFFLHEYLHFLTAVKLGYKPEWYRTRFMMGFDIDTKNRTEESIQKQKGLSIKERRKQHMKENKLIALSPYTICVPLSIALLIFGMTFSINGLIYAGTLGLIGHGIAFPMEAKQLD